MTSWWQCEYNRITPTDFLRENWQRMTDREIAAKLSAITERKVSRDAVKKKRQGMGLSKAPDSTENVVIPEWSIPDPTSDVEPYKFTETGKNTGTLIHVREVEPEGAIKTVEQVIEASGIDLSIWRVGDRIKINKWPVGAKAEQKDIRWEDGRIVEGFVKSDGLTVAQLWQVEVPFVRIEPKPIMPIIQPVECSVTFEQPPKPAGGLSRSLVFSDTHLGFKRDLGSGELIPLHDNRALDVALQVAIAAQVDRVDMLGDIFDLSDVSDRYVKLPEFQACLQPAIITGHWWLSQFRRALPEAYMAAHEGNHDLRLMMAIVTHLKTAYDLRAADELSLPPALSVPRLLALHRLGIVWIGSYPQDVDWLNEDLRASHGKIARSQPGATARAIVEQAETSEIVGHIHRMESASKTIHRRNKVRVIQAHCLGCMCHIDGRLPSTKGGDREQWQQGFAVIDYDPNGIVYNYTPVMVQEGKAVWNGQLFVARDIEPPVE